MTEKLPDPAQAPDMQLMAAVRNSAQQIWRAGLGAYVIAREGGSGIFAKLVKQGSNLQVRTQQLAGEKISDVIAKMTETIGKQTAGPLGKMEEAVGERVTRTLRNFGVPTQEELRTLTKEIEDLRKTVIALSVAKARGKKAAEKMAGKKTLAKTPEKEPAGTGARKSAAKTGNGSVLKKQVAAS